MQTIEKPILGLEFKFPETVYVLHLPKDGTWGCYCHDGIHGLAAFEKRENCVDFMGILDIDGLKVTELSFDEALDVAKARPFPVETIMLLDDWSNPPTMYVK